MNLLRRPDRRRPARRPRRALPRLAAMLAAVAVAVPLGSGVALAAPTTASPAQAAAGSVDDGELRVLLFYKPNFHASHVQARQAVRDLATDLGAEYSQPVDIQETEDPAAFTTENLATKDAVVFAQTGGVLFNVAQRAALESYIRGGGGYMGLHYAGWSVGQSEHDVNPFYARLVGAASEGHPEDPAVRPGRVVVEDSEHPLTQGLPAEFTRSDEWYDWLVNPAPNVRTLLNADESSYGGGNNGTNHPITWCQEIDSGRSWYSGMGHEGSAYAEAPIRTQMKNGLAYSAGLLPADCSAPDKAEQGSWSGVTPWPLVPINAALTSDGRVQSFGSVSSGCTDGSPYDFGGNSCVTQGGQMEIDVWDPAEPRTVANVNDNVVTNSTYTDLFCSMQVQMPHRRATMTVGGDDGLGGNAPNDASLGVTSYTTNQGLRDEAPMNYPRWYPTGTTLPDGSVVVQGGSLKGGPGGPGVLTPEIYTPDKGSSWELLEGATSAAAYGDGGNGNGPDENRWWYPRAFVAPGNGNVFNITGTQMYELDPSGDGEVILRGTLPTDIADQDELGNPVGATSTATMYRPGKILQVGGGWWANGGGPDGARAGFTVDITGGTDAPVVEATEPMEHQRHWATSTVLPDGNVIVTGGSRDNNGNGGYVTTAEIWNPDTGEWTEVEVPYEHARLYHSTALLLPDGRLMVGGGGTPGPRNYTDVEFYSPAYLFDGDEPAVRPEVTGVPKEVGYDGTFDVQADGPVSRVTLVRNGSVTHGFNNDQNFQDLAFSQTDGALTVETPVDGTYAPPGAYMLFVFDEDGTPSVADIVQIDPTVEMDARAPHLVDQLEYPRIPAEWRSANPPAVVDVEPGNGRMSPWEVDSEVQLVRAAASSQGGLGATGYHLGVGSEGSLTRTVEGLDPGREYRMSLRYARDSRSAGTAPGTADLSVGDLSTTLTADPDVSSQDKFGKYVGTFVAGARSEDLTIAAGDSGAGVMVDDLVIVGSDPGASDVPVHYELDEGSGTRAANTGTDASVGAATLTGATGWSENGVHGDAVDLAGGSNANAVDLPDNLLQGEEDFTTSFWVRPDTTSDWAGLFHLGDGLEAAGSFFQIQLQTNADGATGLAATFKAKGDALEERVYATPTRDVTVDEWNHVAFTRQGATGTLYLNGEPIASRDDLTIDMTDVGPTANNWLGRNGFPDPAYDGLMDDVRVYSSTLGDADIAAMYADGTALATTTTVTVEPASPSPFAEPVDVSAVIAAGSGAAPSGVAELWVDETRIGGQVDLVDGAVRFTGVALSPGEHDVEVRFLADEGWRDSAQTVQHTVERPPPGEGTPIHYPFDEGEGTTAANTGLDSSVGAATLSGAAGWTPDGKFGAGIDLPGGAASTGNQVELPDNVEAGMEDQFSVSVWARPDALPTWVPLLQIGSSTDTFFLLQSNTQTSGATGFAATFKAPGTPGSAQERLVLGQGNDLPLDEWTHVVFTQSGSVGKIYFDGELQATRDDFTVDIGDVGVGGQTTTNLLGGTSWGDARWDGLVDDFRMFGYELTAEQVGQLHAGPAANVAPVGAADAYGTVEDEPLTVAAPGLLANDTDVDGDDLTATGLTQPANGAVDLAADGSFTYTPDAGFAGTDTFTYRASDGTVQSAATTVTITVEEGEQPPVNTAPEAGHDAYTAVGGEPLMVPAPGVLANDTDEDGNVLTATGVTQPANGEVTLEADGSFTYTSDAGFSGKDVFTYRADDGTDRSAAAKVTITVKSPAVTAVVGVALPITYGTAGTVSVAVSPDTATGEVELFDGDTSLGKATVADGRGTLVLPAASLRPAVHDLTLRYGGDADHRASSSKVRVVVEKVVPTMEISAERAGKRAVIDVSLTAENDVPVTGEVRVAIKDGSTLVGTLENGRASFEVPRPKQKELTLTASYLGSELALASSTRVTIRVR
ncbi:Type 1 glutamine amidotransferase (GATase1) [Promicromonospora umidemergens]|uniref:LamG-like jellyroll fold domain-containing protein n=1 Tax=Promicromonospora umidemergens TaxID=629679 RepID=A0ABP8XCX2_9MICO|nr:LamG-like jellyroll fold domain-containing protein [Promicromonospora umidemergens]MCP2281765.1 Type 1 glutamine amidotransferase (GATase1) [Promicromonospora umidemergens]